MRTRLYTFYLYTFLAISIAGCRGCSCNSPTTYVLETVVEEIQLDSNNVARIRIEHLEKKGLGFTFKFKKHGGKSKHVIRYNLQFNDRPYRDEVFEHDAIATDSMNQHRNDISVQLSPDKLHILVSYEGEAVGVYHLLAQGMPFTTSIEPSEVKKMASNFASNSLLSPDEMMLAYVSKTKEMGSNYNNKYIKETLTEQESPCGFDKRMLDHIGLPLADAYFGQTRVNLLCQKKHAEWRTRATKLVYKHIGEACRAKYPFEEEGIMQKANGATNIFANGLNNYMDRRAIERQVFPKHPYYPFAIKLFHDTEEHRSLRKNEAKSVEKNCMKLLTDDPFRESLPDEKLSADQAIEFLIRYRDDRNTRAFELMIAAIFRLPILRLDGKSLEDEILFPYDTRFSETEQKIILSHARSLAKQLPKDENNFHLEYFLKKIDMIENPKKESPKEDQET